MNNEEILNTIHENRKLLDIIIKTKDWIGHFIS